MMLMMRQHGEDVYMTSQLCYGVAAKFWKMWNFLKGTTPQRYLT